MAVGRKGGGQEELLGLNSGMSIQHRLGIS